jgi:hypothetical protein
MRTSACPWTAWWWAAGSWAVAGATAIPVTVTAVTAKAAASMGREECLDMQVTVTGSSPRRVRSGTYLGYAI